MVDASGGSVVSAEVARFDGLAAGWWESRGAMAPLHAMNPARVGWVDGQVRRRFGRPVRLLDVGCGGGLAAEALARLGHEVTGIDAAAEVIAVAEAHARGRGLDVVYRHMTAEALAASGARYEAITSLEVIEHVADPAAFLATLAGMLVPGGVLCLSTLNRTRRSWVVAKFGAEYVLRLLPAGTHRWSQFITPAELAGMLRRTGLLVQDVSGLNFSPLTGAWRAGGGTQINYLMAAARV